MPSIPVVQKKDRVENYIPYSYEQTQVSFQPSIDAKKASNKLLGISYMSNEVLHREFEKKGHDI